MQVKYFYLKCALQEAAKVVKFLHFSSNVMAWCNICDVTALHNLTNCTGRCNKWNVTLNWQDAQRHDDDAYCWMQDLRGLGVSYDDKHKVVPHCAPLHPLPCSTLSNTSPGSATCWGYTIPHSWLIGLSQNSPARMSLLEYHSTCDKAEGALVQVAAVSGITCSLTHMLVPGL